MPTTFAEENYCHTRRSKIESILNTLPPHVSYRLVTQAQNYDPQLNITNGTSFPCFHKPKFWCDSGNKRMSLTIRGEINTIA